MASGWSLNNSRVSFKGAFKESFDGSRVWGFGLTLSEFGTLFRLQVLRFQAVGSGCRESQREGQQTLKLLD